MTKLDPCADMAAALNQVFELDNIEYEIAVREEADRYFVTWCCKKCNAGGKTSLSLTAADESLKRAEDGLRAHHAKHHVGVPNK